VGLLADRGDVIPDAGDGRAHVTFQRSYRFRAFTKDQQERQRVLRHVTKKPGIEYRDLMRACTMSKKDMDRALKTLMAEERIRREGKKIWPEGVSGVSEAVSGTGTDKFQPTSMRVK
jgi:hypothetical protein